MNVYGYAAAIEMNASELVGVRKCVAGPVHAIHVRFACLETVKLCGVLDFVSSAALGM